MTAVTARRVGAGLRRRIARSAATRRRSQQGAIAAMVALMLTVVIGMAAIAVDLGMQRVVRSDMQALADVVALDAARLLDGRTAAQIRAGDAEHGTLESVVAASVARNSDATLGSVSDWDVVLVATEPGPHGDLRPVSADHDGNPSTPPEPQEVAPGDVPGAVYVRAQGSVDFAFVPGSGGATRSAMATASSGACFSLGSYAASLSPGSAPLFKDLLGPLVGSSTLNLVGYNGLASAYVSLLDVITAPSIGVGAVDELLAMPSISVGSFYLAMAHALQGEGKIAEAAVFQAASARAVAPIQIGLGELFGLSTATDAALASRFNALDLLVGAAFLADGDNLVGIPNLQAGLPSVGVTNTNLTILEGRRPCNEDEATTAQIRLTSEVKLSLAIPLINTPLVRLRLTDPVSGGPSGEANLLLDAEIAGARARLTSVECTPDVFTADVWTDLVRLRLDGNVQLRGQVTVTLNLGPLSLPTVVDVPVRFNLGIVSDVSKPADTSPTSVQFSSPPQTYGEPVKAGGGTATMPHVSIGMVPGTLETGPVTVLGVSIATSVLDAAVNPVLAGVMPTISGSIAPLVNPVIDKVNGILGPLTAGMGLTLAGADFYAHEAPQCSAPQLRR